ncbi:hypothetical protein [Devosia salina]|uniref:Uncharacterized protein n=1 Tax=Devosia salina TaxID=2860336 RepID=A0ABX8WFT3_9HYPH|nr:hypothetical protein [Devosia salina]QYO75577.1 hypothetical protein K1X15_13150 [Devosia salina]
MKRTGLIGAALAATAITLFSIAGSSANPATVLPVPSYVEATFVAPSPFAPSDLVLAISDLVDVERMIRETDAEERARHQTVVTIPALQNWVG